MPGLHVRTEDAAAHLQARNIQLEGFRVAKSPGDAGKPVKFDLPVDAELSTDATLARKWDKQLPIPATENVRSKQVQRPFLLPYPKSTMHSSAYSGTQGGL
jgi:hypothetical protein